MEEKNGKQLKLGAILSYVSIAVNIIAGLIYTPWMIRQIGQSQYGLFTLANSLIALFLIDFGLSSATARYLSKYHAEGDQEKANNFLGVVYKLYFIIDAVIFIALAVVFVLIDVIYVKLTPEELAQFKVVYLIAGGYAVCNFPFVTFNGILTAYEKFIPLKVADLIQRFLIVGLMVAALLLGYGLYALVTVNALAGLLTLLFKYIVIKKTLPIKVNFKFSDRSLYKDIFGFSLWSTVAALAQRLIFNITPSILGIVADSAEIAVFGIITTIEQYSYMITGAINGMFMPKISRIYADKDGKRDIMPLMLKVGRFQYALNGLLIAGFAIVGRSFISLWAGEGYEMAYYGILCVIVPGIFFNSLQIANTTAVVENKVKLQAVVYVAMGLLNVVLSFILSYFFGALGASLSIFVAYMFRAVVLNIVYYKKMGINTPLFAKECYLKMSVPVLVTIAIGLAIDRLIPGSGWGTLALKVCLIGMVYLLAVLVLGLKKEERSSLKKKILRR